MGYTRTPLPTHTTRVMCNVSRAKPDDAVPVSKALMRGATLTAYGKTHVKETLYLESIPGMRESIAFQEDPYQSTPRFEKLLGDLEGAYSRRINIQHRLVHQCVEGEKTVKVLRYVDALRIGGLAPLNGIGRIDPTRVSQRQPVA